MIAIELSPTPRHCVGDLHVRNDRLPVAPVSREDLVGAYRQAGGPALSNLDWYQALAHFRLGAIACLNVKLHRTGKRTDSLWERFASSISILFARGIELARRAASG